MWDVDFQLLLSRVSSLEKAIFRSMRKDLVHRICTSQTCLYLSAPVGIYQNPQGTLSARSDPNLQDWEAPQWFTFPSAGSDCDLIGYEKTILKGIPLN